MRILRLLAVAAIAMTTASAQAELITAAIQPVNNSSVAALSGYVTQDIVAQVSTRWYNSELLLNLTSGSIYQDAFGSDTSPNAAFFTIVPSLQFDTFVTAGHIDSTQTPSFIGGAVDLGGNPAKTFSTSKIDATWFTNDYNNSGSLTLARISLSSNAEGTFGFLVNAAGGASYKVETGVIHNGVLSLTGVPEPASVAMLLIGGLATGAVVFVRRRRCVVQ